MDDLNIFFDSPIDLINKALYLFIVEKKEHKNWGGARKGAGHPATGINYKCLTLTLSIKQADELRMYAANEGLTVSQFVAEKCGLSPKEQKEPKIVKEKKTQSANEYGMVSSLDNLLMVAEDTSQYNKDK